MKLELVIKNYRIIRLYFISKLVISFHFNNRFVKMYRNELLGLLYYNFLFKFRFYNKPLKKKASKITISSPI